MIKKTEWMELSLLNIVVTTIIFASCSFNDDEEDGPPPEVRIVSATDMGKLEQSSTISGRDGGYSVVYKNRSIWLYGDTFLKIEDEDGYSFVSNTWSWTDDFDASDGITAFRETEDSVGAPKQLFSLTPKEIAFNKVHKYDKCLESPCGARWAIWPAAAVTDVERNRILVFYEKVYAEPVEFSFQGVGHSLAVWNNFDDNPERPVFNPESSYPTIMFEESEPNFGSAAMAEGNMLYVYGCNLEGFDKPCRLARVPFEFADSRDAWEFFTGHGWSHEIGASNPIFNGNDIMTVYYNQYIERYVALYSQPMDTEVMIRTAIAPEGPWSKSIKVFTAIAPKSGSGGWVYDALLHPEYDRNNGRVIYITYSRQIAEATFEVRLISINLEKAA